eukprot:889617-Pyramimonas_sp.AAC.1
MPLKIFTWRSCVCDPAVSWQFHARASGPICGGARAKQQGYLHNSQSKTWNSMARELRRPNGTQTNHASAVHLSIRARVDNGVRTYVQSPKNGPEWGHVVRRVTMNLGDNQILQDIEIQDQAI